MNVEAARVLEVCEGAMWLLKLSKMFEVCEECRRCWGYGSKVGVGDRSRTGRRYMSVEIRGRVGGM